MTEFLSSKSSEAGMIVNTGSGSPSPCSLGRSLGSPSCVLRGGVCSEAGFERLKQNFVAVDLTFKHMGVCVCRCIEMYKYHVSAVYQLSV